jgi:hypothetical protein
MMVLVFLVFKLCVQRSEARTDPSNVSVVIFPNKFEHVLQHDCIVQHIK